jgi:hypothetical protein
MNQQNDRLGTPATSQSRPTFGIYFVVNFNSPSPFLFVSPSPLKYFPPAVSLSSYVVPASSFRRFHCLTVVLSLFSTPSSYLLVFIQVSLFLYLSLVSALDAPLPPAPPASGETPLPHPMRIQSDTPTTPGSLLIPT